MRALVMKEWIKMAPWIGVILAAHLLFGIWFYLKMAHQFRVEHAEMIFYQANQIGRLFYEDMRYVPLVTGIAIGLAQFLPEIIRGRLRLAMHLPIGLAPLILAHLGIGLAVLLALLALDVAILVISVGNFFPGPFVASAVATALPWMLAGIAAYLGTALVLIEPDRFYQAVNAAIVGGLVWLCHLSGDYNAYDQALAGVVVLTAAVVPWTLLAAHRFRHGDLA